VGVFDLDSIQFVQVVRTMRDKGTILGGEALTKAPDLFIGAAANPFGDSFSFRVVRLARRLLQDGVHPDPVHLQSGPIRKSDGHVQDKGLKRKTCILGGVHSSEVCRNGAVH